jgi:UDP-N-acetylglucosamine 1-carboxyvinyltransferase
MKYEINGGNRLSGEVVIAGAKNAALGILAAAIMTEEDVTVENVPDVQDIQSMLEAIVELGGSVTKEGKNTVCINAKNIGLEAKVDGCFKKIRASYYFVGALLSRFKKAIIPVPGGCQIGERPINLHLKGFRALGAYADVVDSKIVARADNLIATHIYLDTVSVGATINIMLAATMADGTTYIENVAKEPHVVDVANFLNSMGANVRGAGTDTIRVRGVKKLHGTTYSVIPDQIEAGTYMCLAAATEGDILIKDIIPKHLDSISAKLIDMGNNVIEYDEALRVVGCENEYPTQVKTLPYPGFPTDMQPQVSAVLAKARGVSKVEESIFESRFKYVEELKKMGAKIDVKDKISTIEGVESLNGADLVVPDLRAGAALVIAALSARGKSTITNIEFIKRGYEDFENKLIALGADIKLIEE